MKTFIVIWFIGEALASLFYINRPREVITPAWGVALMLSYVGLAVACGFLL